MLLNKLSAFILRVSKDDLKIQEQCTSLKDVVKSPFKEKK